MNGLTADCIAIDTNIFEHLFNPENNENNHIDKILKQLKEDEIECLVDCDDRIRGEYKRLLKCRLERDTGSLLVQSRRNFIKHWGKTANQKKVDVDHNDELMVQIKTILKPSKDSSRTDLIFVYVAFKQGRRLITNDRKDIIDGPGSHQDGVRRKELLKKTKQARKQIRSSRGQDKSGILTSQEAYAKAFCPQMTKKRCCSSLPAETLVNKLFI